MVRKTIITLFTAVLLMAAPMSFAQDSREPITPDNASQLAQLIRLGRGSADYAAFTPDGETLAVASTVGVWLYESANLATEQEPTLLQTDATVRNITISSDNTTLFAALSNGDLEAWDLETQKRNQIVELSNSGDYLAINPDGTLIAVNAGSRGINLLNLNANTETLLEGSFQNSAEVAFSPDGAWLAAVGSDYAVYFWDVANSTEGAKLEGHTRAPESLSFSPDGSLLATGSGDATIRLWNVDDGTEHSVIDALDGDTLSSVTRVRFSPDGSLLASGHNNGDVVLWEVATGSVEAQFTNDTGIHDLIFSPDGSQIITIDTTNRLLQAWDVESGELLADAVGHTPQINALTFSPDSSALAFIGSDGDLWIWDTTQMQEINFGMMLKDQATGSGENLSAVAYSSDGALLAVMDAFSVRLLDAETHNLVHELEVEGIVDGLTFSPDDSLLAAISSRGFYVFDVSSGEQLAGFTDHHEWLTSVAFSPDQSLIATSARDNTVRVYGIE